MNYLAHLFLAGTNPEVIFGNFVADHVKGNGVLAYSELVQKGIAMHRAIDLFTDRHDIVRLGIARLRPHFHKYSGVVVDMYYDHYLSANWNNYSDLSLEQFAATRFKVLNHYTDQMPERSARLLHYMQKQNWLVSYGSFEGLQRAFEGMASRTSFISGMEHAVEQLRIYYDAFESEFTQYFPELQDFVKSNFHPELSLPRTISVSPPEV